ncbi:hypothetical protein PPSIR1_32332 [Plesiocystis pacifica SIR-1]|uniref:HTTM domain-containing protein n=1 Tax=Plesiocystis pacifica SIR-1 TaxID=391625 RepID=A6G5K2_9BACT|nr:hypothetical protein [Plesiocystis pacifica]EDM78783.1 hypothetical protein PPSIR1_32332 [Plesiocystis pacifica SIR-1]
MSLSLLALAEDVPNYDAIALSPGVGWMLLAAVTCLSLFFIAHRDSWRELFLRLDDPRPMAAMRIAFGFVALCNVNGLWELYSYLFTDEGLFPTDVAQHFRARGQFAGFGDGVAETDPWGFFSSGAAWEWIKGPNWSLLLFDSSPTFFWTYWVVLQVAMLCLIFGFQTKWIKWIAWFLYMGLILRNTLFWEATENVYRVFFLYLCLSRCGEAWSVDNWLRCRRLRKRGRLSEPGKPGEGAGAIVEGKVYEPIYRRIPGWPRMLVILNVATLYCATGTLKNGPIWNQGHAFYYSFNLDHFYRLPPQQLSALFGTTLFRLNTWVVHWWEALFPVMVLAMIVRWYRREQRPRLEGARLWLARLGLGGFVACFYAIILYSYPVHYKVPKNGLKALGFIEIPPERALLTVQLIVAAVIPLAALIVVAGFRALRRRADTPRAERGALPWLDLEWVCRWILGRRVWLLLGMIFHGHLILTMNIGWFSPGLLACYFAFLNGEELAMLLTKIGEAFHRWFRLPVPKHVAEGRWRPAADPRFPRRLRWRGANAGAPVDDPDLGAGKSIRDGFRLPDKVLFTCLGVILIGVLARVYTNEDIWRSIAREVRRAKITVPAGLLDQDTILNPNWFVAMAAVIAIVVMVMRVRAKRDFNAYFIPVLLMAVGGVAWLAAADKTHVAWGLPICGLLAFLACRGPLDDADEAESARLASAKPWAYGPVGRTVIIFLTTYHISAVATTQFPDKDSWSTFRRPINETYKHWLRTSQTTQGWGMFAPNPPRRNVFLRAIVVDQEGERWDLNTDVYACFAPDATDEICDSVYPIPWIWYSRQRKMNRRIAGSEGGKGSWYQKWHARYLCRKWELEHDGVLPQRVELYKIHYPIPAPDKVFMNAYDPKTQYNRFGNHKKIHTTNCLTAPLAQSTNEVRARYGFEPREEKDIHLWSKHRCRKWEEKLIEEARAAGAEVDVLDPRFDVCPGEPKEVERARKALEGEATPAEGKAAKAEAKRVGGKARPKLEPRLEQKPKPEFTPRAKAG